MYKENCTPTGIIMYKRKERRKLSLILFSRLPEHEHAPCRSAVALVGDYLVASTHVRCDRTHNMDTCWLSQALSWLICVEFPSCSVPKATF